MQKLLLILFISFGISVQAQEFKIQFSTPKTLKIDPDFHRYGKYLISNETEWGSMQLAFTANLKKVNYGIEITQYDEALQKLKQISIDNNKKDLGPFSPMVHYGESDIYVIYFRYMDNDKIKMFVTKVDPETLTVTDTKEILEYDQKNQGFWGSVKTIDDIQMFYTVSKDGKNVWIIHASPTQIISTVIDGDLNIVQKAEAIPVKLKKLKITGVHIDNNGNKTLAYRYDDPAQENFFTRGVLFQRANSTASFKNVTLPNGYFPGNLTIEPSKDGSKLYYAGEYLDENYKDGNEGVLLGEINTATQSVSTPKFYPYTSNLKQRVLDLDFASRKKGNIVFTDRQLYYEINEMTNGTIVLSTAMYTSNSTTNYTFYYAGPIVHIFIKPDGSSVMTLIPKKQASSSITGYFNYVLEDKFICIYADIPRYQSKDYKDSQIDLIRTTDNMVPVANVYDESGNLLSRKMLVENTRDMKGNVMISNLSKIGDAKFLFPVGENKVNLARSYTRVNQVCYLEITK